MPAERVSMRKTREILRLRWGLQRSLRDTAASCGVGATTVHDVVARARAAGLRWPLPAELDDAALEARLYPPPKGRDGRPLPDFTTLYRELKRRGVTLELLWQEYRQGHPECGYGYSRFCDLYRAWRGQLDLVMRQEHRAGEKLFVDYAGRGIDIVDPEPGTVTEAPVFVAALGASSFTYAEACEGQDLRSWIAAHIHTFEYIEGVAAITVPDNLKAGVTTPDRYEPELNPTYRELAAHYGTTIIPARVRRPRDKAKVENAVQQVSPLESSASLRASSSLQSPGLNRTLAPLHPEGSMVGITSYDTYIPMLRLPLATVAGGKAGGPEKAVANWDEDGLNAGTSEVQRNIIAQRVLGLPRA